MEDRLRKILIKINEYEKETPYNFCDRWCERCEQEKQLRCRLYGSELEQKLNCIGNGRDENDPEITGEVIKRQFDHAFEKLDEKMEEITFETDEEDESEMMENVKEHMELVNNDPLALTAKKYFIKAHEFLKKYYYDTAGKTGENKEYFETIIWYHSLLPVKVNRALAGFHEPMAEGDISLYDAVGQFQICKKAIARSLEAFERISRESSLNDKTIIEMKALLHNMNSRIDLKLRDI